MWRRQRRISSRDQPPPQPSSQTPRLLSPACGKKPGRPRLCFAPLSRLRERGRERGALLCSSLPLAGERSGERGSALLLIPRPEPNQAGVTVIKATSKAEGLEAGVAVAEDLVPSVVIQALGDGSVGDADDQVHAAEMIDKENYSDASLSLARPTPRCSAARRPVHPDAIHTEDIFLHASF